MLDFLDKLFNVKTELILIDKCLSSVKGAIDETEYNKMRDAFVILLDSYFFPNVYEERKNDYISNKAQF